MKTQKNSFRFAVRKAMLTLIAAVAIAITQVSFAATGPKPAPGTLQSTVFPLPSSLKFKAIVAAHTGKLSVSIRNQKKEVVYSENLKSNEGYIRTFDLGTLPDGEYTFEISNGTDTRHQTFQIETTTARVVNLN